VRLALVFGVVGQLIRLFSIAFLAPMAFAALERDWTSTWHFAVAAGCGLIFGTIGAWLGVRTTQLFQRSEALAVVAFTWFFIAVFAAIPYVLAGLAPVDAFFESMSGITTTGATIFTDFTRYSRAIFLWRAMTQWFGGLGVIALFVVVLPRLGIAGRQLFFAEASAAPGEAISPQVRHSARRLWMLYTALTLILAGLLMFAGMDLYEAVLHSLTTLSAGGFSPNPESIAGYGNPAVEWILIVFMLLAGTSFTLQWRVFGGQLLGFFRDGEFKLYFIVTAAGTAALATLLAGGIPTLDHVRLAAFQSVSLASSTGYASTDYEQWGDPLKAVLTVVMIVGGCAGSAAGGPKAVRYLLRSHRIAVRRSRTDGALRRPP
jgi:trk system potassium uptake protein